jgi:hypothetical protein
MASYVPPWEGRRRQDDDDEPAPKRQFDDDEYALYQRLKAKFERHDRPERQDKFYQQDRPERQDKFYQQDRPERQDKFYQQDRPARSGGNPTDPSYWADVHRRRGRAISMSPSPDPWSNTTTEELRSRRQHFRHSSDAMDDEPTGIRGTGGNSADFMFPVRNGVWNVLGDYDPDDMENGRKLYTDGGVICIPVVIKNSKNGSSTVNGYVIVPATRRSDEKLQYVATLLRCCEFTGDDNAYAIYTGMPQFVSYSPISAETLAIILPEEVTASPLSKDPSMVNALVIADDPLFYQTVDGFDPTNTANDFEGNPNVDSLGSLFTNLTSYCEDASMYRDAIPMAVHAAIDAMTRYCNRNSFLWSKNLDLDIDSLDNVSLGDLQPAQVLRLKKIEPDLAKQLRLIQGQIRQFKDRWNHVQSALSEAISDPELEESADDITQFINDMQTFFEIWLRASPGPVDATTISSLAKQTQQLFQSNSVGVMVAKRAVRHMASKKMTVSHTPSYLARHMGNISLRVVDVV